MNESTLVRALIPQAGLVNEPKQWYVAWGYSLDRRNKFFVSDITNHLPETVFTKCKPHSNRAKHSGIENFQTCYILHMHYKLAFGPTLLNFMHVWTSLYTNELSKIFQGEEFKKIFKFKVCCQFVSSIYLILARVIWNLFTNKPS